MVIQKTILFIIILGSLASNAQRNIYVKPDGSDSKNGLHDTTAVRTIQKAKEIARSYISSSMSQDIVVNIAAGVYTITKELHFEDADSGKNGKKVYYKASQNAYLTSGVVYSNWSPYNSSQNIWQMNIGDLYSRQVYRNGVKAKRANNKNNNYNFFEHATGYFASCNIDDFFNWTLNSRQTIDLEMVSNNEWKSNRVPILSKFKSQLCVNELIMHLNDMNSCNSKASWLENSLHLVNEPDEWYIDRSVSPNKIYYKTASNSPPGEIVIPILESLITGDGASNLIFDGLIFQYTTWLKPSNAFTNTQYPNINFNHGLLIQQADVYFDSNSTSMSTPVVQQIPAAVSFINSNNIKFINNKFEHMGATALNFKSGCSNNKICNNTFSDICASAISLGYQSNFSVDTSNYNLIQNNTITNIANEYFGSVGIFIISAKNSIIRNNDISNFPYTGISLGWGWSSSINFGKNIIENNKIDCSNQTMRDGGAIYTLSAQGSDENRTIIKKNFILNHHIAYGAIYLDKGSRYINVLENVIKVDPSYQANNPSINWLDNVNWGFIQHYYTNEPGGNDCKSISFENNYYSATYPGTITPPSDGSDITIANNSTNFNNISTTIENASGINLQLSCQ